MSGELDRVPNLPEIIDNLRRRVYELEHRISGDSQGLDLGDLNDVRVDALGDATITLVDGDALTWRESDNLWVPGTVVGGSSPTNWLTLYVDASSGHARTVDVTVDWDDFATTEAHGSAIALTGGNTVTVSEDGYYTMSGYVFAQASSSTFDTFDLKLVVNRSFSIGGDTQPNLEIFNELGPAALGSSSAYGELQFHWTGYLMAGDTAYVVVGLNAPSGSATWDITDGAWWIEQLPI